MCGRYTLAATIAELERRFDVSFPDGAAPRYNAAPGQELAVIPNDRRDHTPDANETGDGAAGDNADASAENSGAANDEARFMGWGFTPSWADESFDLINARAETITEKRSFADAYECRRCLVPADGFYEWTETDDGKHPYRVAFEDDRVFAMAGIYERWQPPTTQTGLGAFTDDGEADTAPIETFAVVTTEPNAVVSDLHHRMAVILPPDRETEWLTADPENARELLSPYPPDEMHSYRVSDGVGDPSNDDPSLLDPASD